MGLHLLAMRNEDLIKYGWPEDIWFHVDKLSSAHVYLRMPKGLTIEDIPKEVLIDCVQLVKNNSIQGQRREPGGPHTSTYRGSDSGGQTELYQLLLTRTAGASNKSKQGCKMQSGGAHLGKEPLWCKET
ncbi:unnamed protein product [Oncorhynchus mykiss]|uniref:Coiled-coil domain-containing protein 25 n=1 Tax=Oncorhynchus mykiss TaxID=8022 RepID=A0A060WFQ7_ONCMY|nr:unnamed protein product [Oncorhynchus mykiss]